MQGLFRPLASAALLSLSAAPAALAANGFPQQHYCTSNPKLGVCVRLLEIKNPNWNLSQDLIIAPHRGYWGFGDVVGVPENSLPGFQAVASHGYAQTEADFTPTSNGQTIMSHDYVLTRTTDGPPPPAYTYTTSSDTLQTYHLRDRAGNVTSNTMETGQSSISVFQANGTVAFVDIKQQPNSDPAQYAINWVTTAGSILKNTRDATARSLLVFKTSYTPAFIRQHLPAEVKNQFYEVQWMPQVGSNSLYAKGEAPGVGTAAHSSADFVDIWAEEASSVAAFEVNAKNTDDSRLGRFPRGGVVYDNLLDYIKQTTGYRGGVFSEEPIGPRGVPNRMAIWAIKNTAVDRRGDYLFEAVGQTWGNFIIVTTDRADIWQQVQEQMYAPSTEAR